MKNETGDHVTLL